MCVANNNQSSYRVRKLINWFCLCERNRLLRSTRGNLARAFSLEMSKAIDSITHRTWCTKGFCLNFIYKLRVSTVLVKLKLSADDRLAAGSRFRRRWRWLCIAGHRERTTRSFPAPPRSRSRCRRSSLRPPPSSRHRRWFRNWKRDKRVRKHRAIVFATLPEAISADADVVVFVFQDLGIFGVVKGCSQSDGYESSKDDDLSWGAK